LILTINCSPYYFYNNIYKYGDGTSLETTVGIAKVGTTSSRATVTECIVASLGIEVGDKLQRKMDMQANERVAIVTKKSKEKDSMVLARYFMAQKQNKLSGGVY
jgi:hypothetical protein